MLLLHADETLSSDVQSNLLATGAFAAVDLFNANAATPSLSFLQTYNVVLTWTDDSGYSSEVLQIGYSYSYGYYSYSYSYVDEYFDNSFDANYNSPFNLGNLLAQYWDNGGAVVVATFANVNSNLLGRLGNSTNGYILLDGTANVLSPAMSDAITVLEPSSPLMTGVTYLSAASAFKSAGNVINGGVVVAKWNGGQPLVVQGSKNGRPLVAVNMFPPSSAAITGGWTGDGAALLRNALLFSACTPCLCVPCQPGSYSNSTGKSLCHSRQTECEQCI